MSLNINFFLRNFVQAVGTLIFLFLQSWKLSLVAFVSVPAIVVISRVYVLAVDRERYLPYTLIAYTWTSKTLLLACT